MKTITFRLKSGKDLKQSIEKVVTAHGVKAGFIITCVGALQQATIRMAGSTPNAQDVRTMEGDFEIVSLVGTVSTNGTHLHISFSDKDGVVHGGHLMDGTIVCWTAEIVIGFNENLEFTREPDEETGFKELVIR